MSYIVGFLLSKHVFVRYCWSPEFRAFRNTYKPFHGMYAKVLGNKWQLVDYNWIVKFTLKILFSLTRTWKLLDKVFVKTFDVFSLIMPGFKGAIYG